MEQPRINLNSNERLARTVSGIESDAKHFIVNGESADETLKREAANRFNNQVDEYVDKFNKHAETIGEYAKSVKENMHNLEIMPIYNYILARNY